MPDALPLPVVERVSQPPHCAFFGYYDKCPWDRTGRLLLAHRADPATDPRRPGSRVTIGHYDLYDGSRFTAVAETNSWNWQQGSMLQWLESDPTETVLFNRAASNGAGVLLGDDEMLARLVTSFETPESDVDGFLDLLRAQSA